MSDLAQETPEQEIARLKRHLQAEQDAATRLMNRFCKAMGEWVGCWDNAVEEKLRLFAEGNK